MPISPDFPDSYFIRGGLILFSQTCHSVVMVRNRTDIKETQKIWHDSVEKIEYLLHQSKGNYVIHKWGFPKGHFEKEKDRDTRDTAIRETFEETGLTEKDYEFYDMTYIFKDSVYYYAKLKISKPKFTIGPEADNEIDEVKLMSLEDMAELQNATMTMSLRVWEEKMSRQNPEDFNKYQTICEYELELDKLEKILKRYLLKKVTYKILDVLLAK